MNLSILSFIVKYIFINKYGFEYLILLKQTIPSESNDRAMNKFNEKPI